MNIQSDDQISTSGPNVPVLIYPDVALDACIDFCLLTFAQLLHFRNVFSPYRILVHLS